MVMGFGSARFEGTFFISDVLRALGAEGLPILNDSFAAFGFMGTRFFAGFLATSFFNRAFFGTITGVFAFPDDNFFEILATVSFLIAINPPHASDYIKL